MNACVLRMVTAGDNRMVTAGDDTDARLDDTDALLEARRLSRGNRALQGKPAAQKKPGALKAATSSRTNSRPRSPSDDGRTGSGQPNQSSPSASVTRRPRMARMMSGGRLVRRET